ncbi:MAG: FkbM family methyltransferase [Planctomycetota bacterium]|jgi:FkbM family methyltransferase
MESLSPTLFERSIVGAQSATLKAVSRLHLPVKSMPLIHPRCRVHTGGTAISHLYDDVFCKEAYVSPKPLRAKPRIVDAGGHLGLASIYFLTQYDPSELVVIEANPHISPLLTLTLAPWGGTARVLGGAISMENGTTEFHITSDNLFNVTGGIDNRENDNREVNTISVPTFDAREILKEPVDLMKLDVEGHEYELLHLEEFRPDHVLNLVIEFHDVHERREEFDALIDLLVNERGYKIASSDSVALTQADLADATGSIVLKLY